MSPFRSPCFIRLLSLCSCISLVFSAPVAGSNPTVTLASGIVIGTTTRPTNQPSLTAQANAYLGVPFALSPPERFSPPEAVSPWSSPLAAQTVKPACIQQFSGTGRSQELSKQYFGNPTGPLPEESEDCLYLNVYTPPDVNPSSKKAVMFWIFGVRIKSFLDDNAIVLRSANREIFSLEQVVWTTMMEAHLQSLKMSLW
jgi:carboxylesterase 2